jgi:hypothetical protein
MVCLRIVTADWFKTWTKLVSHAQDDKRCLIGISNTKRKGLEKMVGPFNLSGAKQRVQFGQKIFQLKMESILSQEQ